MTNTTPAKKAAPAKKTAPAKKAASAKPAAPTLGAFRLRVGTVWTDIQLDGVRVGGFRNDQYDAIVAALKAAK